MKLTVEQTAARWYIREMNLSDGDHLRIFVRLGGSGSVQPGFSLGVMKDVPRNPGLQEVVEGITFYMEADNLWYLEEKQLLIRFNELEDDITMDIE
ncbi:HesB/YadR/YfhF family protein [Paenibacillus sp. R14(2021)]|uniref:HesB/YadR/YfhF family protein n=1 Tax=Paenibacillus sp. R14(2021) TaxID=2859228 RepID=UPI001C611F71|nr:HesB/YadR/YfhF family protein [Paenibacillus sp. R14(2021)]